MTDILETGYQYTKNIPLALIVSTLFLFEIFNILPSYINSAVIPLENSLIIILFKEIILALNSLYINSLSLLGLASTDAMTDIFNTAINNQTLYLGREVPLITNLNWAETLISSSHSAQQIVSVAYNLYTYGAFLFILLGMILLLAMIAPIYLSRTNERN